MNKSTELKSTQTEAEDTVKDRVKSTILKSTQTEAEDTVQAEDTVKDVNNPDSNLELNGSNAEAMDSNERLIKHMDSLFKNMKEEILGDVQLLISSSSQSDNRSSGDQRGEQSVGDVGRTDVPLSYSDITRTTPVTMRNTRQPHPSSSSNTSGYSTDTVSSCTKQEKVVVLSTETNCEVDAVVAAIDKEFKNIKFSLVKKNKSNKKIILSFPSEKDAQTGKDLLKSCKTVQDNNYVVTDAKKMQPKVTISNVPNYLTSHIAAEKDNMTPVIYRDELKKYLSDRIMEKNDSIRRLRENGETFDIVYVNVGKISTTLGVRVSPIVREEMLFDNGVYVGNARCPVTDRFFIKQCFKCQKIGHFAAECQETNVICMYCSGTHKTGTCPTKQDALQYRCRNCAQSSDPGVRLLCNSHHSGSYNCPTIAKERIRLQERTEYQKN